ncbi:MAG TPA: hypothetical protein PK637_02490 [Flavobacteriales bacterium]|nr:hypothetical protein [Flavobacteriales bacterium]HRE95602.1 hypothetical protein [Flavobacteriales bacterium]HRJ38549.1 hypothetical protein [Flavobacteriales bacterium]
MKAISKILALLLFFISPICFGQEKQKPSLTVLHVDVKGVGLDPESAGNMLRREVEKLDLFSVTDRYDVTWLLEKNQLKVANCYGKLCLVEIGKTIQSDKMLSGSIEMYSDIIVITLRLIDVKSASVERTAVKEFLNLPKEVKTMVGITIREMFGIENEKQLIESLTVKNAFANSINQPNKSRLALDGPRMGCTLLTGTNAEIFKSAQSQGGFDGFPLMFQFGYQFEKQYLNEGNFQALFEFIPMITGLDQGLFIPSMTVLHGLRGNKKGWEFAFGPTVGLMRKANGYIDPDTGWQLASSWTDTLNQNPYPIISRMDSRGDFALSSGFVFAFGRSFKSGKLNIPFNAYVVPQKNGMRFGVSFGFNARK